jgi:hypothetical protein
MKYVLLEMDRILRPEGHVIMRDAPNFIEDASVLGKAIKWKCKRYPTEKATDSDKEQMLICQKTLWRLAED